MVVADDADDADVFRWEESHLRLGLQGSHITIRNDCYSGGGVWWLSCCRISLWKRTLNHW